jgi:hypothetical protein
MTLATGYFISDGVRRLGVDESQTTFGMPVKPAASGVSVRPWTTPAEKSHGFRFAMNSIAFLDYSAPTWPCFDHEKAKLQSARPRATISCANATNAWLPLAEGSNTTPGMP